MKKITIKAVVGKVYPPKKICVFINNMDNDLYDRYFESQKSFNTSFDASKGAYVINVIGMNQDQDDTTVTVGGDFQLAQTKKSSDGSYVMVFIGHVN